MIHEKRIKVSRPVKHTAVAISIDHIVIHKSRLFTAQASVRFT